MMLLPMATIAFSGVIIVLLCRGDPKRRRTAGLPGDEMRPSLRRILAGVACLPGLLCAVLGDSAAFIIWLGGCAVLGWFVALWFGQTRQDAR